MGYSLINCRRIYLFHKKAAENMRITAQEHLRLKIDDVIILASFSKFSNFCQHDLFGHLECVHLDCMLIPHSWQIGECVANWWRPNFETVMYPYCPSHITMS